MHIKHDRVYARTGGTTRTQQAFKPECDINRIMQKYQKVGQFGHVTQATAAYGDFSTAQDYMASVQSCRDAQADFDGLPSSIRDRFKNDPGALLDFLNNQENEAEAQQLGLIPTPEIPAPATPDAPSPEDAPPSPEGE